MRTLDINECAEFLKVDVKVASRLAMEGTLPGAKVGRAWVFLEDDLADYLRQQVRLQMRKRQVEAEVQDELDKSVDRMIASQEKRGRGAARRNIPPPLPNITPG